jgi:hypothetical protein
MLNVEVFDGLLADAHHTEVNSYWFKCELGFINIAGTDYGRFYSVEDLEQ